MFDWVFTQFGFSLVLMFAIIGFLMSAAGISTLAERKISAWVQDRVGPNRAGPMGLLQPLADGVKFIFKEDFTPGNVDKPVFILAPMLALIVAMIAFAVIPWGGQYHPEDIAQPLQVQVSSVNVGLLYILAVGSMGVYGVVLGSWASNNKYSFYGGMRAAAQMLSYEVPMALAIMVVVLTVGELRLETIVAAQTESLVGWLPRWNIFYHPLAFVIMLITVLAETNRAPFDLAECEQELVGGFHTEYSSMKFALFFLGEYIHMLIGAAFLVTMFFGGWHLPGIEVVQTSILGVLLQVAVMIVKTAMFMFLFIWIRWTLPRFRFDQLMRLTWKGLVPLAMVEVLMTCALVYYDLQRSWWASAAGLGLVVLCWFVLALRPGRISGRQAHLRPIAEPRGARMMVP